MLAFWLPCVLAAWFLWAQRVWSILHGTVLIMGLARGSLGMQHSPQMLGDNRRSVCRAPLVVLEGYSNCLLWQAFFADIYAEAQKAAPARGHEALAAVACLGRLRRHYTLNIDGLAESVGLATWHPTDNPTGAHPPHGMMLRMSTFVVVQETHFMLCGVG